MAENSNILITVTADDSGAITKINKLGQEINLAGDASKSWIQQLAELKTKLASVDTNSKQWAELALQYRELGGSSKVVSQSVDELRETLAAFNASGQSVTENLAGIENELIAIQNTLASGQVAKGSTEFEKLSAKLNELQAAQKAVNTELGTNAGNAIKATTNDVNALAQSVENVSFEKADAGAKSWIQQLSELKKQLAATEPNTEKWTELAIKYTELGGSAKIVGQSLDELRAQAANFGSAIPTQSIADFQTQISQLNNQLATSTLPKTSAEYQNLKSQLEQAQQAQAKFNAEIGSNTQTAVNTAGQSVEALNSKIGAVNFDAIGEGSDEAVNKLKNLEIELQSIDPNSKQWAELALQYKELGGSSDVVSQSVEELSSKVSGFNDKNAETLTGVEGLKAQLKALQTEFDKVAAAAPGGGRYQELAAEIANVKSQITNASNAVQNEGVPAFEGFASNTAAAGEKLKSFDIKGVGDQIKASAENVKNFKFGSLTTGLKETTQGFGSLAKALVSNPLFLVAQIVIGIVTNFDKLAAAIPLAGKAFEIVGNVIEGVKNIVVGFTDAIGLTSIAAADAIDAAIGNRDRVNKELDNQRRLAVAKAKAAGEDVDAINKGFEAKRIADNQALIDKINAQEATGVVLTKEQLDARQKLIDENTELAISAAEKEAAGVEQARNDAAKNEEKRLADEAKAKEEAIAKAKERAAQIKASEKEVTDAIAASREEQFQAGLTAEEKELRQVALKYDQLKEKAGNNKELQKQLKEQELIELQSISAKYFEEQLTAQAEADAKLLAEQQAAAQKAIEDQNAAAAKANEERIKNEDAQFALEQEFRLKNLSANEAKRQKDIQDLVADYDAKLLIAKGNATLTAELEKERNAELERINKEYRDAEKAADEKSQQDKLDAFMKTSDMVSKSAQDGLATLSSLNELFTGKSEKSQKAAFQRNKAIQIGQATVNTYQSATSAYASQVIPGDPTSIPRAVIAAASAVAAGLANVAKIKATTFNSPAPSGGGGGGGGGGGELASQGVASVGPPQFNPLAGLNLNQPQQIQPAYVLASDIASSMEARSKVEDLSRL